MSGRFDVSAGSSVCSEEPGEDDASVRCPRCLKSFVSAKALQAHEENGRCRGVPPLVCPRCHRVFQTRQAKHSHVRRGGCTPAGVCPHMCENVDYLFGERCMQVLAMCGGPCDRVITAAKLLWANGEHPENHNVRIKDRDAGVLEVCRGDVWYEAYSRDTLERMVSKVHALLARHHLLDANAMYECPDVGSALLEGSVDLSGLDADTVAALQEREAEERGEQQAIELHRHLEHVRVQKDHVFRELMCMLGSSEFRERSGVRAPVLRTRGILPFDEVDEGDVRRIMEHPGHVAFTADECVRIHTGADASKHSVLPSLDGRTVRVRTRRGWVVYRRDYFPVLVFRKITAVLEDAGYDNDRWTDLEGQLRAREGPALDGFRAAIDALLDRDLGHVRASVTREPARLV